MTKFKLLFCIGKTLSLEYPFIVFVIGKLMQVFPMVYCACVPLVRISTTVKLLFTQTVASGITPS